MCFNFMTGRTGPSTGPQSSADKAAGGFRPSGTSQAVNAANPHNDAATPQGQRSAVTSQQTADRNTIRRADSYGSRQAASKVVKKDTKTYNASAVQGGKNIMSALNTYNTNKNKKTILGS